MREEDLRQMTITVAPGSACGSDNEIECDISGSGVHDDAIFLPKDGDYEITFNLDRAAQVDWDQDPFCAQLKKCPRPGTGSHGLMKVKQGSVTAKSFVVEAKAGPTPARRVFHYRLNFSDGSTCDPIIIRD